MTDNTIFSALIGAAGYLVVVVVASHFFEINPTLSEALTIIIACGISRLFTELTKISLEPKKDSENA